MKRLLAICLAAGLCFGAWAFTAAFDDEPARPRVFLDKSPRIVWFQLDRLDNERLLLVERKTDDAKYVPVYQAILTRAGMATQNREEALAGLTTINGTNATTEVLAAMDKLDADDRQDRQTADQLAGLLLSQPAEVLKAEEAALKEAIQADNALLKPIGYAGLIVSDGNAGLGKLSQSELENWLAGVRLVPEAKTRGTLWTDVIALLDSKNTPGLRKAAIRTLAAIPQNAAETMTRLAPFVSESDFRDEAVRTLLRFPIKQVPADIAESLVNGLVAHAESTPAALRTTPAFLNAMQLADRLLSRLPVELSRATRKKLSEISVRVVQIHTVEEEMRYDVTYFAVEAGRPVQLVLKNEDLMPHNLVITQPGALQEIAEEGAVLGPKPGFEGKPYVPKSEKVMHATGMVPVGKLERLTFTAPESPGEYPYVCTFPRHWMRMYGVMVVVEDLDAWLKNPVKPKDPIGSNREFVQAWKPADFTAELEAGLQGRSPEIGGKLFKEATCAQCHQIHGMGGKVGPDLTEVFKRWKGDRAGVLREILEPSHRIEPKYAVQMVITSDGLPLTGIVTAEDKESISLLINPEAAEPRKISRDDIEEMVKSSKSMMPKALLDRFTKDEVLEILAYLEHIGQSAAAASK